MSRCQTLIYALFAAAVAPGCSSPECAWGDYGEAECRVVAENHYARVLTSNAIEVRFQHPAATDSSTWDALGLLQENESGVIDARPATLMDFAISIDGNADATLTIHLENVAPDATVSVGPQGAEVDVPAVGGTLRRTVALALVDDTTVWVRGTRACPDRYRLVTAGDIQTNPLQFERIVEDLHAQLATAEAAGEPLLGFFVLGDVTESTAVEEFERIRQMLQSSPVPVSVVPGNHDIFGDHASIYNRWFGPGNYVDRVCRTKLIHLDNASGHLADSIEARLPSMLDPEGVDHLVPAMHIPPHEDGTSQGMRDQQQAAYMLSEFARNGIDRIMAGHVHYWRENRDVQVGDQSLHQIISGTAGGEQGSGHLRFGVTRLSFGGPDEVASCFHEVPVPGTTDVDESNVSNPIDFCTTP